MQILKKTTLSFIEIVVEQGGEGVAQNGCTKITSLQAVDHILVFDTLNFKISHFLSSFSSL